MLGSLLLIFLIHCRQSPAKENTSVRWRVGASSFMVWHLFGSVSGYCCEWRFPPR